MYTTCARQNKCNYMFSKQVPEHLYVAIAGGGRIFHMHIKFVNMSVTISTIVV
jgi:hypothetical protein